VPHGVSCNPVRMLGRPSRCWRALGNWLALGLARCLPAMLYIGYWPNSVIRPSSMSWYTTTCCWQSCTTILIGAAALKLVQSRQTGFIPVRMPQRLLRRSGNVCFVGPTYSKSLDLDCNSLRDMPPGLYHLGSRDWFGMSSLFPDTCNAMRGRMCAITLNQRVLPVIALSFSLCGLVLNLSRI